MKAFVELEWNDNAGPRWMNPDNLAILLYSPEATKRELLRITKFEYGPQRRRGEGDELYGEMRI